MTWPTTRLGEVVESLQNGCGVRQSSLGTPTVVLRLADVDSSSGAIASEGLREVRLSAAEREKYQLRTGDLLAVRVNGSREIAGRVVAYKGPLDHAYCDHFIRVRPGPQLDADFLAYALRSHAIREQVNRGLVSSAGQHTISQGTLTAIDLPLPPLDVQRRIVAKLDALLAQSRAAREQLEAVPDLVEKFRQSVLAAAFRGDLTADWRKKNPDVEPASKLLERIRVERRKAWEAAELAKMKAKGKVPKDDKWKAKYVESEPVDIDEQAELPPTWTWCRMQDLAEIRHGFPFESRFFSERGDIVLTPGNFTSGGELDFENKRVVRHLGLREPEWTLRNGDLLVVMTDLSQKRLILGAAVLLQHDEVVLHNQRIGLVVPNVSEIQRSFLRLAMLRPQYRQAVKDSASGTLISHTSPGRLLQGLVPLPPVREQHDLVVRVAAALASANQAASVDEAIASVSVLESALLAKAFSGQLVP